VDRKRNHEGAGGSGRDGDLEIYPTPENSQLAGLPRVNVLGVGVQEL
jgi:hypothetical protein